MKNILVPVNYTPHARNAAEYAIHLAKFLGCSIEFLHVYPQPETVSETEENEASMKELVKSEQKKLKKEAKIFSANFNLEIKSVSYPGELDDILRKVMFKQAADLVVTGMKGSSVIDKISWGNTTSKLIKHATYPLLIIPSEVKFVPVKHITLAADYYSLLSEKSLSILKSISKTFKGKIQAVHVEKPDEELAEVVDKSESIKYFNKAFEGIIHSYVSLEGANTISGLDNFIKSKNSNMIVMVPQKHNFWQKVFLGSTTKKMAYQTEIPLMLLPYA